MELSRLLDISFRTAQRITAGDQQLRIDQIVELASLFGDDVLNAIPRTVVETFPEPYRLYLEDWRAGRRELPAFALQPIPGTIAWEAPVADLSRWLSDELHAGRIGLVNESVVAHHLAKCLADAKIPSSLIMAIEPSVSAKGWVRLDILTRVPARVHLGYLLDPLEDPLVAVRDTLNAFYEFLPYDGHRLVVLCMGHRMSGQLQVHLPSLAAPQPGEVVTIPFQVAAQLGVPSASDYGAPDLALAVEASVMGDPAIRVVLISVGKIA
jgi:hypothetical protein